MPFTAIGKIAAVCFFSALCLPVLARGGATRGSTKGVDVPVHGYTRADGKYVQPHMRTAPDTTPYDNYSTKGNYNPYTGQLGTKNPDPSKYGYLSYPSNTSPQNNSFYSPLDSPGVCGGYTLDQLNLRFGQPYKTHNQKIGTSVEYAQGHHRTEFFLDVTGKVWDYKQWNSH